jgi:hypothetical protein
MLYHCNKDVLRRGLILHIFLLKHVCRVRLSRNLHKILREEENFVAKDSAYSSIVPVKHVCRVRLNRNLHKIQREEGCKSKYLKEEGIS